MVFEWDEAKRHSNLLKHGVDFEVAIEIFLSFVIGKVDDKQDYGEERVQVLGEIEGRVHVVVYTDRPSGRRIISARKANEREQRTYHTAYARWSDR